MGNEKEREENSQIVSNLVNKTFYIQDSDGKNKKSFRINSSTANKRLNEILDEEKNNKSILNKIKNFFTKPIKNFFFFIGALFTGGFIGIVNRRDEQKKKHIVHKAIRIQKGLQQKDNNMLYEDIKSNDKNKKKDNQLKENNNKDIKQNINLNKLLDNKFDNKTNGNLQNKDPLMSIGNKNINQLPEYEEDIVQKNENKKQNITENKKTNKLAENNTDKNKKKQKNNNLIDLSNIGNVNIKNSSIKKQNLDNIKKLKTQISEKKGI